MPLSRASTRRRYNSILGITDTCGATIRPAPIGFPPTHAAADPTSWTGSCVAIHRSSWRPAVAPPQLPVCLHGTSGTAGQGACQHEEERRRTRRTSPLVPDKARTPKLSALNAPCPVMRGISSHHCTLSTSCVPLWRPLFPIKGGPRRPGEGFGFLEFLTTRLLELMTPHS